ncbi:MAG: methionyl-tRNA formyltransferase [Proteobacteria bacterium]|nr:methionyl-tRNA formyltransferase [Pseudomonadota bacterium]
MRIVIAGHGWFAAKLLVERLHLGDKVLAVLPPTQIDRLAAVASSSGIRVTPAPSRVGADCIPEGTDVILAAHAHAYIGADARRKAQYGALGYHPSLLPRHRGMDAVRWTLRAGDAIAGGTLYWLDDGMDTGPIAAQDFCFVLPGDDAATLWRRDLAPLGLRLFRQTLELLNLGVVTARPQLEAAATLAPRLLDPSEIEPTT